MERFLGKYSDYFYALLRIVAGLLFAMHGSQKLFGWPGNKPTVQIASQMGIAGVIELVCGLMIALGLLTSFAAFLASGEMAFAYFMIARSERPFADYQRRRTGSALLLSVPLHCLARIGSLERRLGKKMIEDKDPRRVKQYVTAQPRPHSVIQLQQLLAG